MAVIQYCSSVSCPLCSSLSSDCHELPTVPYIWTWGDLCHTPMNSSSTTILWYEVPSILFDPPPSVPPVRCQHWPSTQSSRVFFVRTSIRFLFAITRSYMSKASVPERFDIVFLSLTMGRRGWRWRPSFLNSCWSPPQGCWMAAPVDVGCVSYHNISSSMEQLLISTQVLSTAVLWFHSRNLLVKYPVTKTRS